MERWASNAVVKLRIGSPASLFNGGEQLFYFFSIWNELYELMTRIARSFHRFQTSSCFGTMAALRLVPLGVGLNAFAVSQSLRVRFEVVLSALPGVVDSASIGDVQGV